MTICILSQAAALKTTGISPAARDVQFRHSSFYPFTKLCDISQEHPQAGMENKIDHNHKNVHTY